jgi:signal transduction histidine kinase
MPSRPLATAGFAPEPDVSATEGLFSELLIERGAFAWNKGFLDLMPTAVFVCDEDGRVACFNDKAVDLWGRTPSLFDLRERYAGAVRLFWPGGRPMEAHEVPMLTVVHSGIPIENGELLLERPTGARVHVQFNARPLKSPTGKILGSICALEDISELRHAHSERDRLVAELERALTVRDEFLSVASHELKTPLTALFIQVDSLLRVMNGNEDGTVSRERLERAAKRLRGQMTRLTRLVDDLVDVSQLADHPLELSLEPVSVAGVVLQVVERLADKSKQKRAPIQVHLEANVLVRADPSGLDQVLTNLLDNAIKYGEDKPVDVSVVSEGAHAKISVRDHGIGVASGDQYRIFERFERAVSDRHYGGLGLGLWICRNLVDAMDGSIEVRSEESQGATFTVTLPLVE